MFKLKTKLDRTKDKVVEEEEGNSTTGMRERGDVGIKYVSGKGLVVRGRKDLLILGIGTSAHHPGFGHTAEFSRDGSMGPLFNHLGASVSMTCLIMWLRDPLMLRGGYGVLESPTSSPHVSQSYILRELDLS